MIGKLRGVIDTYGEDFVVIDVHGVGYVVHCSARTLQSLPPQGEAATISIETHVREQEIKLFGFTNDLEREWFRMLQTVPLAILSTLKPAELANAIALGDKTAVSRTPGVGPKLAARIVAELKDKAPAFATVDPSVVKLQGDLSEKRAPQPVADAVSALVHLGYGEIQAGAAVAAAVRASGDENAPVETLIRLGLKELAR
jgi:Holliday junction DNA helicase RuvA